MAKQRTHRRSKYHDTWNYHPSYTDPREDDAAVSLFSVGPCPCGGGCGNIMFAIRLPKVAIGLDEDARLVDEPFPGVAISQLRIAEIPQLIKALMDLAGGEHAKQ